MHHAMSGGWTEPTAGMKWGTLCHSAVLEPETFFPSVAIYQGKTKRGKEWDKFEADNPCGIYLKQHELDQLHAVRDALMRNAWTRTLLEESEHEVSLQWEHKLYGRGKARLDGVSSRYGIYDYKTTGNICKRAFTQNSYNLKYHLQFGFYGHAIDVTEGETPPVRCIVQEPKPPYDSYVMLVPHQIVTQSALEAVEIAQRYNACRVAGTFMGVAGGQELEFELPEYAGSEWEVE